MSDEQLKADLDEQIHRLRVQIAYTPPSHRSYAERARQQLDRLSRPDLDLRDRLEAVRRARLELSDSIRFGTSTRVFTE